MAPRIKVYTDEHIARAAGVALFETRWKCHCFGVRDEAVRSGVPHVTLFHERRSAAPTQPVFVGCVN